MRALGEEDERFRVGAAGTVAAGFLKGGAELVERLDKEWRHGAAPARGGQIAAAHGEAELGDAFALGGAGFHDYYAEEAGELLGVHSKTALAGDVHHVEDDDGGEADFEDLGGEEEVTLQVAGVYDADDGVWLGGICAAAKEDGLSDGLVWRAGGKAVGAREVDECEGLAVLGVGDAFFALHGDARIVGHLLAETCKGIEEGGLARVWVADHGKDGGRSGLGNGRHGRGGKRLCDGDQAGFGLAEGKAVAAELNLQGVAEGGLAEELDGGAREEAHLLKAEAVVVHGLESADHAAFARGQIT